MTRFKKPKYPIVLIEIGDFVEILVGENEGYTGVLIDDVAGVYYVAPSEDSDEWFTATKIRLFKKAA